MFVITHKKIFYAFSGLLVACSLFAIGVWGLNLGIDFTGGSALQVAYEAERPAPGVIEETLGQAGLTGVSIRIAGDAGYIIRTPFLEEETQEAVVTSLEASGGEITRLSSVGPTIGNELRRKALVSIGIVVVAIILFIAFAFRKVSKPVSSWKYGVVAVLALTHDVIIPTGVFALLGRFGGVEIDTLFVTALLVILGYSVNDTIVVFDRIRENLRINQEKGANKPFRDVVGKSLEETYARSINTALTTLLALVALFVFAGSTVHMFILALMIGVALGTYSSIFLASPLLLLFVRPKG